MLNVENELSNIEPNVEKAKSPCNKMVKGDAAVLNLNTFEEANVKKDLPDESLVDPAVSAPITISFTATSIPPQYVYRVPDGLESDPEVLRAENLFYNTPETAEYSEQVYGALKNIQSQCAADYATICAKSSTDDFPEFKQMVNQIMNDQTGAISFANFDRRRLEASLAPVSAGRKLMNDVKSLLNSPFQREPLFALKPVGPIVTPKHENLSPLNLVKNVNVPAPNLRKGMGMHMPAPKNINLKTGDLMNKKRNLAAQHHEHHDHHDHHEGGHDHHDHNDKKNDEHKNSEGTFFDALRSFVPPAGVLPPPPGPGGFVPPPPVAPEQKQRVDNRDEKKRHDDHHSGHHDEHEDHKHDEHSSHHGHDDHHGPHDHPHPPLDDNSFPGALGFGAQGDLCLYQNAPLLNTPCMAAIGDLYQLREKYWEEHVETNVHYHHHHAFGFIIGAILLLLVGKKLYFWKRRQQVKQLLVGLEANPELKAAVEAQLGVTVPAAPKCGARKCVGSCLKKTLFCIVFLAFAIFSSLLISISSIEISSAIVDQIDRNSNEGVSAPFASLIIILVCFLHIVGFTFIVRKVKSWYMTNYGHGTSPSAPTAPATATPVGGNSSFGGKSLKNVTPIMAHSTSTSPVPAVSTSSATAVGNGTTWNQWFVPPQWLMNGQNLFSRPVIATSTGYTPLLQEEDTEMIAVGSAVPNSSQAQPQRIAIFSTGMPVTTTSVPVTARPVTTVNFV